MADLDVSVLPDPGENAVVVVRSLGDSEARGAMGHAIVEHYAGRGLHPLLVMLTPGESIEVLDEEQMRASGWVRGLPSVPDGWLPDAEELAGRRRQAGGLRG